VRDWSDVGEQLQSNSESTAVESLLAAAVSTTDCVVESTQVDPRLTAGRADWSTTDDISQLSFHVTADRLPALTECGG